MHKSFFDKSISYVTNYVISKYTISLELCNLALLLYVIFYITKVEYLILWRKCYDTVPDE